ncbi:homeobox protein H2.0 [Drosophila pseudoobscura]|uniref:Homeobox protein H2.0 n=1 Tax=Drosophila pseudoobscura pseudoobscura TaxID=46245 RepID=A0A6I8UL14_DROPS|nr:homeobox protein H2.0 [Drosophila pseudoobscura]
MLLHESAASMEQSMPENLSTHVYGECEVKMPSPGTHDPVDSDRDRSPKESIHSPETSISSPTPPTATSTTKVKLSFSVDRLLSSEPSESLKNSSSSSSRSCCDGSVFSCCTFPHCFSQASAEASKMGHVAVPQTTSHHYPYAGLDKLYPNLYMDYKSVLRPTPIRANEHATTYPTLATNALLRFHQQHHHHQQQQQPQHHQPHFHQQKPATNTSSTAAALLAPLHGLKSLQLTQQQRFLGKSQQQLLDNIPTSQAGGTLQNGSQNGGGNSNSGNNSNGKRKRSWSRAVFTNLQRKGLEIQFQQQKYITKPDRRKLAARLNLTDAQVKVWFQNRRMKWRHTRENLKSGQEKQPHPQPPNAAASKPSTITGTGNHPQEHIEYSSDSCSSVELSEQGDDDIEIDVVE